MTVFTPNRTVQRRRRWTPLRVIALLLVVGLVLGVLCVGLLALVIYSEARHDETAPADAIIVLGTAQFAGRPSATFQARLDHAQALYEAGYAPLIVLTGGSADGDDFSEAEVGRDYLIERGVPVGALLAVPDGRTSYQSLRVASAIIKERDVTTVLMVSDPFHMFRVKRIAADLGLEPLASPTQTSPIRPGTDLEYRYMARELAAYLAYMFARE